MLFYPLSSIVKEKLDSYITYTTKWNYTIGQSKNNSVSFIRTLNVNQKAYPLADDKKGINANFKWRFCYEKKNNDIWYYHSAFSKCRRLYDISENEAKTFY